MFKKALIAALAMIGTQAVSLQDNSIEGEDGFAEYFQDGPSGE